MCRCDFSNLRGFPFELRSGNTMAVSLVLLLLLYSCCAQRISLTTFQSTDDYLFTTVQWGTPTQTFSVLLDTTDSTSWLYNESVDTTSAKFDSSASTSFIDTNDNLGFIYQNTSTTINLANDTFTLDGNSLTNTPFALAVDNFTITDDEALSGFLSLDRANTIMSRLQSNGYIDNATLSIDVANNELFLGSYTPSDSQLNNYSNATSCSETTNQYLANEFRFVSTILALTLSHPRTLQLDL